MANAPELSLRGGRRPTWQSREGSCDFADSFPLIQSGTARLPRAQSALAMTNLGALCGRRCYPITCQPARRSMSAATDAIGLHVFIAALYGLQVPSRDSHVASLLGMTNRKTSPFYRQPVQAANASPGPAVRSPTARGWEPSCNSPFLIPRAWAGEWSGRSRDPSPLASSPPGCPRCGRARGCDSRCSGTAARPAR